MPDSPTAFSFLDFDVATGIEPRVLNTYAFHLNLPTASNSLISKVTCLQVWKNLDVLNLPLVSYRNGLSAGNSGKSFSSEHSGNGGRRILGSGAA